LYQTKFEQNDCSNVLFTKANLTSASLININVEGAYFRSARIFGLSAWEIKGTPGDQSNLIITEEGTPVITVDDLQVAQFIYLLLNNSNVKNVIDTITSKAVLILGRFTEERKTILDAIFKELREQGYLPILFDFSGPQNRNRTETVSTLAHLAKFVIADITDAKSIPQELQAIVPHLPSVPVQPIILASQSEYGMYEHFTDYQWVLPTFHYKDVDEAVMSISKILLPQIILKLKKLK
jgi:excinuclease UvrABC ATPase subunit